MLRRLFFLFPVEAKDRQSLIRSLLHIALWHIHAIAPGTTLTGLPEVAAGGVNRTLDAFSL